MPASAQVCWLWSWHSGWPASPTAFRRHGKGQLLAELPSLRGGTEVLDRIREVAPNASGSCDWLERAFALAEAHGVRTALNLDFGVLRDWSYYSGAVFEAYVEGESMPLAVGGRYDGLGERFGRARTAVGVAIALGPLHRALAARRGADTPLRVGVVLCGGLDTELALATTIRATGTPVIGAASDAEQLAAEDGWRFVATPTPAGIELLDRDSGTRHSASDLMSALAKARA